MARWLAALRSLPEFAIVLVTEAIACRAGLLPADVPGDAADRIILATALKEGDHLVTADTALQGAGLVRTVW